MKKLICACLTLWFLTVAAGSCSAGIVYNLASLIASGGSVISGDKRIDQFGYSASGDMPDSSGVNITAVTDLLGNFGIRVSGGFADLQGGSSSLATLTYRVTAGNGWLISDAHMFGNPAVLGGAGIMRVTDTFAEESVSGFTIFQSVVGSVRTTDRQDSVEFASLHKSLHVQKSIFGHSTGSRPGTALLSFVDQTYSQVPVPEPASVTLLSLTGFATWGLRRRLRCTA